MTSAIFFSEGEAEGVDETSANENFEDKLKDAIDGLTQKR